MRSNMSGNEPCCSRYFGGTCPVSMMTLKAGVERIIMDRVPGVTEVVADE